MNIIHAFVDMLLDVNGCTTVSLNHARSVLAVSLQIKCIGTGFRVVITLYFSRLVCNLYRCDTLKTNEIDVRLRFKTSF
jgi:hypothetical protein